MYLIMGILILQQDTINYYAIYYYYDAKHGDSKLRFIVNDLRCLYVYTKLDLSNSCETRLWVID